MTVFVPVNDRFVIHYKRLIPAMSFVAPPVDAAPASRLDSRALAAAVGAAVLGGLVYLNALQNPFVYDDYHTVAANASIQHLTDIRAIVLHDVTRPLVNLSYAIDRAVWGPRPFGFHVTNVLLHMLNVVLLFLLARRMEADRQTIGGSDGAERGAIVAFAAAALFAVHPMMTEAVGYISGRSEVLCATFFIPALLCGRRWLRDGARQWAAPTVLLWIAALATKEPAAMFPFVLFAYDWLMVGGTAAARRHRIRTVHLPLMGVAAVAGLIRLAILARVEYAGYRRRVHWPYILVELDVIRRYVALLVHPTGQALFHEVAAIRSAFDPRALVALLGVGALRGGHLAAPARRSEREPWDALVSSSARSLVGAHPVRSGRTDGRAPRVPGELRRISRRGKRRRMARRLGAARRRARAGRRRRRVCARRALVCAPDTWLRNTVWASPVTLWRESVDLAPAHYRPRLLLGEALEDEGRRDEAIEEYKTAIRLRPGEPSGYVRLGPLARGDRPVRRCAAAVPSRDRDRSAGSVGAAIAEGSRLAARTTRVSHDALLRSARARHISVECVRPGLIWTLVRTDFKARYHGTLGGFVWALLKPMCMFVVLMGVFSFLFASNPTYKLDLIIGLFLWDFFAEGTKSGLLSLQARGLPADQGQRAAVDSRRHLDFERRDHARRVFAGDDVFLASAGHMPTAAAARSPLRHIAPR